MSYVRFGKEYFRQKDAQDAFNNKIKRRTNEEDKQKYLYRCFCLKNGYNYLQISYERKYGFIFNLSKRIQQLKQKPSKTNIREANILKNLVYDLYSTNLSDVSKTISDRFYPENGAELKKVFSFSSKTLDILEEIKNTKSLSGESFEKLLEKSLFDNDISNKQKYIDPVINKCVANEKVEEFQQLIKDRVVEERNEVLNKRGFFTKVLHFFIPPLKKAYVNKKLKSLNGGLEKYKKLSSTEEIFKQVKFEKESENIEKESESIFGDTPVGKKLSGFWNGFKLAFNKVTAFLTQRERKVEWKDLEEKSKKNFLEQQKLEKEKKIRLMEQKKQQEQEKQSKLMKQKKREVERKKIEQKKLRAERKRIKIKEKRRKLLEQKKRKVEKKIPRNNFLSSKSFFTKNTSQSPKKLSDTLNSAGYNELSPDLKKKYTRVRDMSNNVVYVLKKPKVNRFVNVQPSI
ncbi:MAG: hypothetical protein PVI75_07655 [Gammaproteobacteria bacterium]|jgi:hypothetical protein